MRGVEAAGRGEAVGRTPRVRSDSNAAEFTILFSDEAAEVLDTNSAGLAQK